MTLHPSDPLDDLLRWEQAGGSWRLLDRGGEGVTVSLCRCDGGEEVDRIVSTDSELAVYVTARPSSED
jgi:hypothetical protein